MAYSWSETQQTAGDTDVVVDIEYLDRSYIYVYFEGELIPSSGYTWASDQLIKLNTPLATDGEVLVVRRTDKEFLYIAFAEGAAFIRENIDTQNKQFLHLAQELVEGRSIEGFYGDLSMNGFRITNLGAGVEPGDAINKGQLDAVGTRVAALENSYTGITTVSYPWYSVLLSSTDTLVPGYTFDKASLYINGVCQVPDYSYIVVDNTIVLADPVPAGTIVFARLGEDTDSATDLATASALAAVQADLQGKLNITNSNVTALSGTVSGHTTSIGSINGQITTLNNQVTSLGSSKAAAGANSDITSLSGLTTALSLAQGGTGATSAAGARTSLGLSNVALGGTAATGTADTAAFNADTTLTFSATYSQAEHTTAAAWIKRIAQRVLLLETALRSNVQKV